MRRGVWVVLGLMGAAPSGAALAQQAQAGGTVVSTDQGGSPTGAAAPGSAGVIEATGASDDATGGSGRMASTGTTVTPEQSGTGWSEADNSGITLEVPRGGVKFPGILGAQRSQRSQTLPAGSGMGGSGQSPSPSAWSNVPNEEVFVGTVRSATKDRLLMQGPSQRVYEFRLGDRTRILGPNGAALSLQSLQEGTPVRTVTRAAEQENQVITLQVLGSAKAPRR